MQGPIPGLSDQYYDLPGVPWNLYFTEYGAVIHGAYWHDNFGQPSSHGCVNLPIDEARKLYLWADVGPLSAQAKVLTGWCWLTAEPDWEMAAPLL